MHMYIISQKNVKVYFTQYIKKEFEIKSPLFTCKKGGKKEQKKDEVKKICMMMEITCKLRIKYFSFFLEEKKIIKECQNGPSLLPYATIVIGEETRKGRE